MQLFNIGIKAQPNPTKMMNQLSQLRAREAHQLSELGRMQIGLDNTKEEIRALESALAEHLGITTPAPHTAQRGRLLHNTQPPATTTAQQELPVRVMQAPQTQHRKPMAHATNTEQTRGVQIPCTSHAVNTQAAPRRQGMQQTQPTPKWKQTPNQGGQSVPAQGPNMGDIVQERAPYHTEQLQITGVVPDGEIVTYDHYLSGDGINYGIEALEGLPVKPRVSKVGKPYRLMEVPALKITCTLARPLPKDASEKKRVIREWIEVNNYLTSSNPKKVEFHTEFDSYGEMYTPYVTADSNGTTLYIYIGATSLTNATPYPWLIA